MKKKRKWRLVMALVVGIGLIFGGWTLFAHSGTDYMTVSQLKAQLDSLRERQVSVGGKVAPGSVSWDDKARVTRFAITDGKERLLVSYQSMVPDTFKPGDALVVKGKYRADNVLEAVSFGRGRSLCNVCH